MILVKTNFIIATNVKLAQKGMLYQDDSNDRETYWLQQTHKEQIEKLTREAEEDHNVSAMKRLSKLYEKEICHSLSKAYYYHRMVISFSTRRSSSSSKHLTNPLDYGAEHLALAEFINRNCNQLYKINPDPTSHPALRREGFRSFYFALEICNNWRKGIQTISADKNRDFSLRFANLCPPEEVIKEIQILLRAYRTPVTIAAAAVKIPIKNMVLLQHIFRLIGKKHGYSKYVEKMLDIFRCYSSEEQYKSHLRSLLIFAAEASTAIIIKDVMHWNIVDNELLKIFLIKAKKPTLPTQLTRLHSTIQKVDLERKKMQEVKWIFVTGQFDDTNNGDDELQLQLQLQNFVSSSRCLLPVSSLQIIGSFLPWFASVKVDEWRLQLFTLTVKLSKGESS